MFLEMGVKLLKNADASFVKDCCIFGILFGVSWPTGFLLTALLEEAFLSLAAAVLCTGFFENDFLFFTAEWSSMRA